MDDIKKTNGMNRIDVLVVGSVTAMRAILPLHVGYGNYHIAVPLRT